VTTNIQPTNAIDPMEMARFFVLDGANRLVTAFSAIPPGILRDSIIAHAEAIATTYLGAPIGQRMPDPIRAVAPAAAIPPPPALEPKTESQESEIVKMRLAGVLPKAIAKRLKIDVQKVYQAAYDARKAGIEMPRRGENMKGTKKGRWHVTLESITPQGRIQITYAANQRGITPEAYMERRQIALRLALENASWEAIMKATGEKDAKVVSAWLSNARSAGYKVPYITSETNPQHSMAASLAERAPEAASTPEPLPQQPETLNGPPSRVFPQLTNLTAQGYASLIGAAKRRGMTIHAYMDLRESVVAHRMRGIAPTEIARLTGENVHFVKDTLASAKNSYGAKFPPFVFQGESEAA
jgi:hypothetical protein